VSCDRRQHLRIHLNFQSAPMNMLSLRPVLFALVFAALSFSSFAQELPARFDPHLFVLDTDAKLLHSQNTGDLEAAEGLDTYDTPKVMAFINQQAVRN
jgi:hypothetical protein